jgi:alcohol dehydrogenase (cytochrome c)
MKPNRTRTSISKLVLGTVLAAALMLVLLIPSLRWRAHITLLYATGQIADIDISDFVGFLSPDSGQSLTRMIETRDPYAVIRIPDSSGAAISAGSKRFKSECAVCHAPDGTGTVSAPSLVGRVYKHGESDWAIYRTIRYGVPNTSMAAHPLPSIQLWELAAYVRSLSASSEGSAEVSAPQRPMPAVEVTYQQLQATAEPSADWLTYSGSYTSTRHSSLDGINVGNIDRLAVKWVYQFDGDVGIVETSPIVRAGVMFITLPRGRVMALDAKNGKVIWDRPRPAVGKEVQGQFAAYNRGVAILNDKVFVGTSDAHLIAMSSKTGAVVWDATVGDSKGYYISGAPLAYRDLVVTGVGTKGGGRGFIAAYDAESGKERWRFTTIPGPGEAGNETWSGDSWREGGAPTWLTGSYDPVSDQLYWGVGNPKPDYDTASRKGDNLYSNSLVALRGATGKLSWHFQFTPADDHDWDSNQIPILIDQKRGSTTEKLIVLANRNGFYYVLNRESGKFLNGVPFAKQTWTEGLSVSGRPVIAVSRAGNNKGVVIYPGNTGATNWWSPSFDSTLHLVFVPTLEQGMVYFPNDNASTSKESSKASWPTGAGRSLYTSVRALEAESGKLVWEHRQNARFDDNVAGGLLSTKGGIVFGSDRTTFFGLDSRTGRRLWDFETGGRITAPPVTYKADDEQFVVIAAGNSLFAFSNPTDRK